MPRAPWIARAFGLTVEGDFPAPGLDAGADGDGGRRVRLRLASRGDVVDRRGGLRPRWELRDDDGGLVMRIGRGADGGYLVDAPGYGAFFVAADGREVLAAPGHPAAWHWQRYLVGQALPLAALLQGLEPLHASAVVLDGRVVAMTGASGSGKTTLATALLRTGASLLCDDVLTLEPAGARVLAHPGPPLVNLREGAAATLRPLGSRELGRDREATRLQLHGSGEAGPLAALYLIDRAAEQSRLALEPAGADLATLLLASSFNYMVTDPARLARQLDLCARIAGTAAVTWVRIPADMDPLAVAEAMAEHAIGVPACAA
jgi:hypothetical protein